MADPKQWTEAQTIYLDALEGRVAKLETVPPPVPPVPPPVVVPAIQEPGFEVPSLMDGTFQYNPTGGPWTFTGASGLTRNNSGFTSGNPFAPEGLQVAFIQYDGSISQKIEFPEGTFKCKVRAAQRTNFQSSAQAFKVLIDGRGVGTIPPADGDYDEYETNAFNVPAGVHELQLMGTNPNGGDNTAFVDEISIFPFTPPPPPPPVIPPMVPPPVPDTVPPPPPMAGVPSTKTATGMLRLASGNVTVAGQTVFINAGQMNGAPDIKWNEDGSGELWLSSNPVFNCLVGYKVPAGTENNGITDVNAAPVAQPFAIRHHQWRDGELSPEGVMYIGESSVDNFYGSIDGGPPEWHESIGSYYHPPFEHGTPPRWYSESGKIYTCPFPCRQGIARGFVRKRPVNGKPSKPEWGRIGALTDAGIRGVSCISNEGQVRLLPGSWGGEPGPTGGVSRQASWDKAPKRMRHDLCPTYPYGWSKENPAAGFEDLSYLYCFKPQFLDNDWVNKWCSEQAPGGPLWLPGIGLWVVVRVGKGPQNYDWQNEGKNPDGTAYPRLVVSYAADCESWACLFREKPDGTFEFDPEWYPCPEIGKPDGVFWNKDGSKVGIFDGMCWNEGGVGATNGAIKFYLAA